MLKQEWKIALVGCGFVADYYLETLQGIPNVEIVGVFDKDPERARKFADFYRLNLFNSLIELLDTPDLNLVVNLTNPRSHYEVSKQCLLAGKHVYTEKPLATELEQAEDLVNLAESKGLVLASAPCSILGESAQTLIKAIKEGVAGKVSLVYAELDDGPITKMHPENWKSKSGTAWPYQDEFEVGCTLEHAGYYLTWLVAIFGEVDSLTSFSSCLEKNKGIKLNPDNTPDFSVACLQFTSGVVARLTCGIQAPHDHSIRIIGDKGVLSVDECWHYGSPVRFYPYSSIRFKAERYSWIRNNPILQYFLGLCPKKIPFVKKPDSGHSWNRDYMNYSRGPLEVLKSLEDKRPCLLGGAFSLHINEITLAVQKGESRKMKTRLTFSTIS